MSDHEDPTRARRQRAELLGLGRVRGDRLLDEHVLAARERTLGERIVRARRRRDHDRIRPGVGHDRLGIRRQLDVGEPLADLIEAPRVPVDHPRDLARPPVVEVAYEVRAPLPGTDHRDPDHRLSRKPAYTSGRRIDHQPIRGFIFV